MEVSDPDENIRREKCSWVPFMRQLLVTSGAWTCYFMLGISLGAPTVYIPQIRKEANSTEAISEEMASWLVAVFNFSSLPWVFILPSLVTLLGRKIAHSIVCLSTFIGFLIFYCSTTVNQILISEIFQGVVTSSFLTVSLMIITEYTSSKYRGVFLSLKSATFFWGILAANAIGTFCHWRKIPLFGLLCSAYTLLSVIIWPESPYWLAAKGRFEECAAAHRWLKGSDKESEKELEILLKSYEGYAKNRCKQKSSKYVFVDFFKTISERAFYKPILLSFLLLWLYAFSGKLVFTVYALDIIKKITKSESAAYTGMLILDGVTVFSMYIGCFVSKLLKRRTMLISFSLIGITFLLLISLYLYLVELSIVTENKYISIVLLSGFSVSIACGPMILSTSITGEIVPLESRSVCICVISVIFKMTNGVLMKVAPYSFRVLGLHGTFCLFGISSAVLLFLIYLYLPETKDKTLQEIADSMEFNKKPLEGSKKLTPIILSDLK